MNLQLEMFQISKEEKLEYEIAQLKEQGDKLRKSHFAKHTELMQLYLELRSKIELLDPKITHLLQHFSPVLQDEKL